MATSTLEKLPKNIGKGATQAVSTQALATVGGLALSRLAETTAYDLDRNIFGTFDGTARLTEGQKWARIGLKAGLVVTGGAIYVSSKDKALRGAAVGLMAGSTWHILNDFGINL